MRTDTAHDSLEFDRENARLAAIGLVVWLALTAAAVVFLMMVCPSLTGFFV